METIQTQNEHYIYKLKVTGMTCSSCENTLQQRALSIRGVNKAIANTKTGSLEIHSSRVISLEEIINTFSDLTKYKIFDANPIVEINKITKSDEEKTLIQTYRPLITLFAFVILASSAFQLSLEKFNSHIFMNHLMAGFFVGLSFFKFLNLQSFAEAFSNYDPVAKRFKNYAYFYAFAEISLGLMYIAHQFLVFANITAIVILSVTTYGVIQHLKLNSKFQCACLGAGFNLPLSKVTVIENLVMISMAAYSLL